MLSGLSLRTIGKKHEVSYSMLSRHRPHIPKEEAEAAIVVLPASGSVTDQLKALIEDTRRVARKAEQSGHLQSAVGALKTINAHLELLGKLTGELQRDSSVAIGVNVKVGRAVWEDSSLAVMDWAFARRLDRMTSFEPEAINKLRMLAAAPCPSCQHWKCQHDLL
jgi:hypothetical protein